MRKKSRTMTDCILCFYFQTVTTTAQAFRRRAGMTPEDHPYNRAIRLEKIIQTCHYRLCETIQSVVKEGVWHIVHS